MNHAAAILAATLLPAGLLAAPPSLVSLAPEGPSPSAADAVAFVATFDQPVVGVDTTDFSLAIDGLTGGAIASVTDIGANQWRIVVDGFSGDGFVRLRLLDDDTITNAGAEPLGGPGVQSPDTTATHIVIQSPPFVSLLPVGTGSTRPVGPVAWRLFFTQQVTGLDATDFLFTQVNLPAATLDAIEPEVNRALRLAPGGSASRASVDLSVLEFSPELTVEFWLRRTGAGPTTPLRVTPEVATSRLQVQVPDADGNIVFLSGDPLAGGRLAVPYDTAADGHWCHYAFTSSVTAGRMRLYIDGLLAAEQPGAGVPAHDGVAWGLQLGGDSAMDLDEVRLTLREKAPIDIYTAHRDTLRQNTFGLVGSWNMSELADLSVGLPFASNPDLPGLGGVGPNGAALDTSGATIITDAAPLAQGGFLIRATTGPLDDPAELGEIGLSFLDDDTVIGEYGLPYGGEGVQFGPGFGYTISGFPVAQSITLATATPTTAASLDFLVQFNTPVTGVDATDFSLVTTGDVTGASITGVVMTSDILATVTVNAGAGDGTIRLDLVDDDTIANPSGPLAGAGIDGGRVGPVYTILRTPAVVASVEPAAGNDPTVEQVAFDVTFSQPVTGVDAADFLPVATGLQGPLQVSAVTGAGAVYTVTVTVGVGVGTVRLDLRDDDSIINATALPLGGPGALDFTAGTAQPINRNFPQLLAWRPIGTYPFVDAVASIELEFTEGVTGLDLSDFTLNPVGLVGAALRGVESIDGRRWRLDLDAGRGNGALQVAFVDDDSVVNGSGNPFGGVGQQFPYDGGDSWQVQRDFPTVLDFRYSFTNPTNRDEISAILEFDRVVLGLDATDIQWNTTGTLTGVTVTGITPANAFGAYRIDINTGTGTGGLQFVLLNDGTITDGGNVLNGTDRNPFVDDEIFDVDRTPPTLVAFDGNAANPALADTITFEAVFSERLLTVAASDFTPVTTGVTGAAVTALRQTGPTTYEIDVATGTGDGTLRLDAATGIIDRALNALSGNRSSTVYTLLRSAPGVVAIERVGPTPTAASEVDFIVRFSQEVSGVDATDFFPVTDTLGGPVVTAVTAESATEWRVRVSAGSGNGALRLDLVDDDSIINAVALPLGGTGRQNFTTGESVQIERDVPAVAAITRLDPEFSRADRLAYEVEFTIPVLGLSTADFAVDTTGTLQLGPVVLSDFPIQHGTLELTPIDERRHRVTITGISGDGELALRLVDDDSIVSAAGVPLGGAGRQDVVAPTYRILRTAPAVAAITPVGDLTTAAATVLFDIQFTQPVVIIGQTDNFPYTLPGGTIAFATVESTDNVTWRATTGALPFADFTVDLSVAPQGIAGLTGVALPGGAQSTTGFDVRREPPAITAINRLDPAVTTLSSVRYEIVYTRPVTGLSTGQFFPVYDAGLLTGPRVDAVEQGASPDRHVVTLSAGVGVGTLGLLVVDNDETVSIFGAIPLNGPGGGTTEATDVYTIERPAPTAVAIRRLDADPTSADRVAFEVEFSAAVTGVDADDFSLSLQPWRGGSLEGAAIDAVSGSGAIWRVEAVTTGGNGLLGLNLANDGSILSGLGIPLAGGGLTGPVYTIFRTVPTVTSIIALDADPQALPQALDTLTWAVLFNIEPTGVDPTDFAITIDGTPVPVDEATITTLDHAPGTSSWTVTAALLAAEVGTVGLRLLDDGSFTNGAGVGLELPGGAAFLDGATYNIDRRIPTIVSATRTLPEVNAEDIVAWLLTLNAPVTGLEVSDFVLTGNPPVGAALSALSSVDALTWRLEATTGTGDGVLGARLVDDDTVLSPSGLPFGGTGNQSFDLAVYTIARVGPAVVSITPLDANPSTQTRLNLFVQFSEPVAGVDATDFVLSFRGVGDPVSPFGAIIAVNPEPDGSAYRLVIDAVTAVDGSLDVTVIDDGTITNGLGVDLGGPSDGTRAFAAVYTLDREFPTATIDRPAGAPDFVAAGIDIPFEVTFSKPVIGVDAADFRFIGPGAGPVTSVESLGGNVYRVLVPSGSMNGPIHLELTDNNTITSLGGLPFGGPGINSVVSATPYFVASLPMVITAFDAIDPTPTAGPTVEFRVTFSLPPAGLTADDFALETEGLTGAAVLQLVAVDEMTSIVRVNVGSGAGTLRLRFVDDDTVLDPIGRPYGGAGVQTATSTSYDVYTDAPRVLASAPRGPLYVAGEAAEFEVQFDQPVSGVDVSDFAIDGPTTSTVTAVTAIDSRTWRVDVALGAEDGEVRLDVLADGTIVNPVGRALATGYTDGQPLQILRTPPAVFDIVLLGPSPTRTSPLDFEVIFTMPVSGVDPSDFVGAGAREIYEVLSALPAGPGVEDRYIVRVVPALSIVDRIRLSLLDDDSIVNRAGVPLLGVGASLITSSDGYDYDSRPAVLTALERVGRTPVYTGPVEFRATFLQAMLPPAPGDIVAADAFGNVIPGATVGFVQEAPNRFLLSVGLDDVYTGEVTLEFSNMANTLGLTIASRSRFPEVVHRVDRTVPTVVAITPEPLTQPTAASTSRWTVTFSHPVNDVAMEDFRVRQSGLPEATIVGFTPGQIGDAMTTATIVVEHGIGSGELTVDLVDRDTIVYTTLMPLGGFGAQDFTNPTALAVVTQAPRLTALAVDGEPTITLLNDSPRAVSWIAEFDLPVTGVTPSLFTVAGEEIGGTAISTVTALDGRRHRVEVLIDPAADGPLALRTVAGDAGIRGASGLPLADAGGIESTAFIVGRPPVVTAFTRANPLQMLTNADELEFAISFSRRVTNLTPADLVVRVDGTLSTPTLVTLDVTPEAVVTTARVTAAAPFGDGRLYIETAPGAGIARPGGARLGAMAVSESYELLRTVPQAVITLLDPATNGWQRVRFAIEFNTTVVGVDESDFQVSAAGISGARLLSLEAESARRWIATVDTGAGDGAVALVLRDDNTITNDLGWLYGGPGVQDTTGPAYTIRRADAPRVVMVEPIERDLVTSQFATFGVAFNRPVTGFGLADVRAVVEGLDGVRLQAVVQGTDASVYTVVVWTGVGDGRLRLDILDDDTILDLEGTPLGGPGSFNEYTAGGWMTVRRLDPPQVEITRLSPGEVVGPSSIDPTSGLVMVRWQVQFDQEVTIASTSLADLVLFLLQPPDGFANDFKPLTGFASAQTAQRDFRTYEVSLGLPFYPSFVGAGPVGVVMDLTDSRDRIRNLRGTPLRGGGSYTITSPMVHVDYTPPRPRVVQTSFAGGIWRGVVTLDKAPVRLDNSLVSLDTVGTVTHGIRRVEPVDDRTFNLTVENVTGKGGMIVVVGPGVADTGGNRMAHAERFNFTIDTRGPIARLFDDQRPLRLYKDPVPLLVQFDEPVTGLDPTDFTFDLEGITAPSLVIEPWQPELGWRPRRNSLLPGLGAPMADSANLRSFTLAFWYLGGVSHFPTRPNAPPDRAKPYFDTNYQSAWRSTSTSPNEQVPGIVAHGNLVYTYGPIQLLRQDGRMVFQLHDGFQFGTDRVSPPIPGPWVNWPASAAGYPRLHAHLADHGATVGTGSRVHYALVYNEAATPRLVLYRDGVPVSATNDVHGSIAAAAAAAGAEPLFRPYPVEALPWSSPWNLTEQLDELRFFRRALAADEVRDLLFQPEAPGAEWEETFDATTPGNEPTPSVVADGRTYRVWVVPNANEDGHLRVTMINDGTIIDADGNPLERIDSPTTDRMRLDTTPPVVIISDNLVGTSTLEGRVTWTLDFGEGVLGFDASDVGFAHASPVAGGVAGTGTGQLAVVVAPSVYGYQDYAPVTPRATVTARITGEGDFALELGRGFTDEAGNAPVINQRSRTIFKESEVRDLGVIALDTRGIGSQTRNSDGTISVTPPAYVDNVLEVLGPATIDGRTVRSDGSSVVRLLDMPDFEATGVYNIDGETGVISGLSGSIVLSGVTFEFSGPITLRNERVTFPALVTPADDFLDGQRLRMTNVVYDPSLPVENRVVSFGTATIEASAVTATFTRATFFPFGILARELALPRGARASSIFISPAHGDIKGRIAQTRTQNEQMTVTIGGVNFRPQFVIIAGDFYAEQGALVTDLFPLRMSSIRIDNEATQMAGVDFRVGGFQCIIGNMNASGTGNGIQAGVRITLTGGFGNLELGLTLRIDPPNSIALDSLSFCTPQIELRGGALRIPSVCFAYEKGPPQIFRGSGTMVLPSEVSVSVRFGIADGRIDEIGLQAENLNRAIGTTGAFLQKLGAAVKYMAEVERDYNVYTATPGNLGPTISTQFIRGIPPITIEGLIGITAGPELLGQAAIIAEIFGQFNALGMYIQGTAYVVILRVGEAIILVRWSGADLGGHLKGLSTFSVFEAEGGLSIWDDKGTSKFQGGARIGYVIPSWVPFVGGRTIGGLSGGGRSHDFRVWGAVDLGLVEVIGYVDCCGFGIDWEWGFKELEARDKMLAAKMTSERFRAWETPYFGGRPLGEGSGIKRDDGSEARGGFYMYADYDQVLKVYGDEPGFQPSKSLTGAVEFPFTITGDKPTIVRVVHSATGGDPSFTLRAPDGTVYTPESHPADFFVAGRTVHYSRPDDAQSANYLLLQPQSGVWVATIERPTTLGDYGFEVVRKNLAPVVTLADAATDGRTLAIEYSVSDPDSPSTLDQLFYDRDREGFDGKPITGEFLASAGNGMYIRDLAEEPLPAGLFWIYAVAFDQQNPPVHAYAPAPIFIPDPDAPPTATNINLSAAGSTGVVTWDAVDDPTVIGWKILWTADPNSGLMEAGTEAGAHLRAAVIEGLEPGRQYRLAVLPVREFTTTKAQRGAKLDLLTDVTARLLAGHQAKASSPRQPLHPLIAAALELVRADAKSALLSEPDRVAIAQQAAHLAATNWRRAARVPLSKGVSEALAEHTPLHRRKALDKFDISTLSDGFEAESDTVRVLAEPGANSPPWFTSEPPVVVPEGAALDYAAVAVDPDGDVLSYYIEVANEGGIPAGLSVDANGRVTWANAQPTSTGMPWEIELVAHDPEGAFAVQTFRLWVATLPVLRPPLRLAMLPPAVARAGDLYVYTPSTEGGIPGASTQWTLLDGPVDMDVDPATGRITWPISADTPDGDYKVLLLARQEGGASGKARVEARQEWFIDIEPTLDQLFGLEPIDATPPDIESVDLPDAVPVDRGNVRFVFTFTEPVSGFTASDLALTGSGAEFASLVSLEADSERVYTATVAVRPGQGGVRLLLLDDDTIVDAAGNPFRGRGSQPYETAAGYDLVFDPAPTVDLTSSSPLVTRARPIRMTATFSEPVTGFGPDDLELLNAVVANFTGSGTVYTFDVDFVDASTALQVRVAEAAATDDAGLSSVASWPMIHRRPVGPAFVAIRPGAWDDAGTWGRAGSERGVDFPGPLDEAVIESGIIVTLSPGEHVVDTVTLNPGSRLAFAEGGRLAVHAGVFNNGGSLEEGTLVVTGMGNARLAGTPLTVATLAVALHAADATLQLTTTVRATTALRLERGLVLTEGGSLLLDAAPADALVASAESGIVGALTRRIDATGGGTWSFPLVDAATLSPVPLLLSPAAGSGAGHVTVTTRTGAPAGIGTAFPAARLYNRHWQLGTVGFTAPLVGTMRLATLADEAPATPGTVRAITRRTTASGRVAWTGDGSLTSHDPRTHQLDVSAVRLAAEGEATWTAVVDLVAGNTR